jgi:hypothetical protein
MKQRIGSVLATSVAAIALLSTLAAPVGAQRADQSGRQDQRDQAQRDQAQRDQAQRDQAQRDQAQRDQAQRDQAQRDQAQRDQAQRDQAQRDQAQRDQAQRGDAAQAERPNAEGMSPRAAEAARENRQERRAAAEANSRPYALRAGGLRERLDSGRNSDEILRGMIDEVSVNRDRRARLARLRAIYADRKDDRQLRRLEALEEAETRRYEDLMAKAEAYLSDEQYAQFLEAVGGTPRTRARAGARLDRLQDRRQDRREDQQP